MACPRAGNCDLPAAIRSQVALLLWQRKCCEDDSAFTACERFKLVESGRPVPPGLLPNGYTLVPAKS